MTSARRTQRAFAAVAAGAVLLTACSAPGSDAPVPVEADWAEVEAAAQGQTVSLWMWGGDDQGNTYVDDVLAPAVAEAGVTLRRVPIADTGEAINRILAERQANITDGDVDLVWVNGDNFGTGKQAGAWLCDWTSQLPNMEFTDPEDPLLLSDFGTPVDGCEAPWHKAQFTLVYDADKIPDPPSTLNEVLEWAEQNPGRFTYPAPPDFTGSVFIREVLTRVADDVPLEYSQDAYAQLSPALFQRLNELAPSLWREGRTYPQTSEELNQLFADGQVDMTMTYGPATLTDLVDRGTFPASTRVLTLEEGTVGNASFLAIPSTSGNTAGARVVANIALSPEQQLAKAQPNVWGQFTVLDISRLNAEDREAFENLPASPIVPSYEELSRNARPELGTAWVPALDEGWRRNVLAGR
ncbi:ABC transporter substrate-binding protein [Hoyosella rhizosphaerae]|uniref:ABC transporter substrate-binding protein n=1 Tax=Hoyosella rhizosphaerae TaxID=1755582 RepID=A0A916U6S2_9ACTN|nr:ABC transporter substrate-binding protein [Hoyosella rhizosphaerae]MBN4927646.1 ABC transporter substrate-binding protein [Hoyosella rhizosphaerae]GGC62803.1 ABC transporter substrate-binding protein [Hoyosella rhizosphaerae]